ncbi:MobA/MobL family protein [Gallibacterium anatis]|uniref:MobA/MobL family protein n=2 Tax=Gallibacterium anatis TaxID=750 RepID=UPI0030050B14
MAIYHLNVRRVSKAKGQSAKAKSNYINRDDKYSSRFDDLQFSQSGNMPNFAQTNPNLFWEYADIYERSNARVCTEIEFALPRELNLEQQQILVNEFIKQTIDNDKHKLPYSFAIHNDPENNNPHCHLIFSERHQDGIDRTPEQFFKRANSKALALGGAMKSKHANAREFVQDIRTTWRKLANQHLEKHGIDSRIDERTLKAQGIERDPTTHIHWREFKNLDKMQRQSDEISQEISQIGQEIAQEKRYNDLREQGKGIFSAKFEILSKNALNRTQSNFQEKDKQSQGEENKSSKNRIQELSQTDFDQYLIKHWLKPIRTLEVELEKLDKIQREFNGYNKELSQLQSEYDTLNSKNNGFLGLWQSKEQKQRIREIENEYSRTERAKIAKSKEYNELNERIEQFRKATLEPVQKQIDKMRKENPELKMRNVNQLTRMEFSGVLKWHKEQQKRDLEHKQEQKQKALKRERNKGLSL